MANGITDKTTIRLPIAIFLSMLIGLVSGSIGAYSWVVGSRQSLIAEVTQGRREDLRHYLSIEQFYQWRSDFLDRWRQDQQRQDREWFQLQESIHELEARVASRRR